jgi:hypothetical protein
MKYFLVLLISIITTFSTIACIYFSQQSISIGEHIDFQDESGQFKFTAIPSKGRDLEMLKRRLESYKLENNISEEVIIYRTTYKNYLNVSKWGRYKHQPEWQVEAINYKLFAKMRNDTKISGIY